MQKIPVIRHTVLLYVTEVLQGRKVATKRPARVGRGRRGKRKRRQVEEEDEEREEDESMMMEESVVGEGGEEVKKLLRQLMKVSKCTCTVDREIFSSLKIFCRWPTMTKIRRTKIFQRQSDEVRTALLGYTKPIRGLPDHHRLFFFSHITNSI